MKLIGASISSIYCTPRASRQLPLVAKAVFFKDNRRPRKGNVRGDFFVDHTCIDCDACRWLSPNVFTRVGEQSAVTKQPDNAEEHLASMQALLACPTSVVYPYSINASCRSSIHTKAAKKDDIYIIQNTFPMPLPHSEHLFYCGFTDEKTFGASSYFIKSPNGNLLVDCPRYHPSLIRRFDEMGGVQYIFLTHIDDVGDHAKWANHYKATRMIHEMEVNHRTADVEIQFKGEGPWTVGGNGDLKEMIILHTPGHTRGSITLYHKPSQSMFTGDHFGYSSRVGRMSVFPRYNWYDLEVQMESVKALLDYDFLRVYPGHGRRILFESLEERNEKIHAFLASGDN